MSTNKFTPEELAAFREEYCKGASQAQFDLFISEAVARNLRPGPHLFFQLRSVNEWDPDVNAKVRKSKATWMSTIAAFRLISQRSGKDAGRGKTRWIYLDDKNLPTIESTIPLPHPENPQLPREPFACVVPVYRSDYKEPVEIVCRFEAYAVTVKTQTGPVLTEMWARRGPEQLEKCSECASRRAAYPEELGNLFIPEEFKSEQEDAPALVLPASVVPLPPVVPKVNQVPATPTETARPNEEKITGVYPHQWVKDCAIDARGHSCGRCGEEPQHPIHIQMKQIEAPASPQPDTAAVEAAKKAVPDLKPASELPAPKRGRKPKSPDNGRNIEAEGGITQADIDAPPAPVVDEPANQLAATEFVDSITNFTSEEAAAQGLPEPPEYSLLPDQPTRNGFYARVKLLASTDTEKLDVKNYLLWKANKSDTKALTVGDWKISLEGLETAQKNGTLKEVLKNVPLPTF